MINNDLLKFLLSQTQDVSDQKEIQHDLVEYFKKELVKDPETVARQICDLLTNSSARMEQYKRNISSQNKILEENAFQLSLANQKLEQEMQLHRKILRNLRETATMLARYSNIDAEIKEENLEILTELVQQLISKREHDRLDLLESQIRYSNLVEQIDAIVFQTDENGKWSFLNKAWTEITRYEITSALGNSCFSFIHPEDAELVALEFNLIAQGKKSISQLSFRIRNSNGSYSYVEFSGRAIFDKTGEVKGVTGTMNDVTLKLLSEKRIAQMKDFYENILNRLPSDIAVFDIDHKYVYANPVAISDPELRKWIIGKDDFDYATLRSKNFTVAEKRRTVFKECIESKKQIEWEETISDSDGTSKFHIRRMAPLLDEMGSIKYVIGYGIDITERKKIETDLIQSESRFKAINSIAPIGIFLTDTNGDYTYVNQEYQRLTGLTQEEAMGDGWKQIIHSEDVDNVAAQWYESVKHSPFQFNMKFRFLSKSNEVVWVMVNVLEIKQNEEVTGFIGAVVNITENIYNEGELNKAKEIAQESLKAKEQFLANMSHEIRSPMNAIMGMSNLLLKTDLSPKQNNYLEAIHNSSKNLLVIINDILDFSKIQADKLELEKTGFAMSKLVSNTLDTFMYSAAEKSIQFNYDIKELENQVLLGDPSRLSQILINLVSNSIKFTEKGGVNVSVVGRNKNANSISVDFTFTDTGIGIGEEHLPFIFDSFSQADAKISRKFGGTGLGLAITKNLVEMMGGHIQVQSKINMGTSFSFSLIFECGNQNDLIEEQTHKIQKIETGSIKVLLAEDHEYNQVYATNLLQDWGFSIDIAKNGKVAIDMLLAKKYDIILMDVQMPVLSGIGAAKFIRNKMEGEVKNIPIIALTANAIKGDQEKCLESGMNDYISKPFDPEILYSKIINLTGARVSGEINDQAPKTFTSNGNQKLIDEVPLVDLEFLKKMSRGNKVFVMNMIEMFYSTSQPLIEQIKFYQKNNEIVKLRKTIHKMKPSVDSMGMKTLKELFIKIENDIDSENLIEVNDNINEAMKLYEACEIALREEQQHLEV